MGDQRGSRACGAMWFSAALLGLALGQGPIADVSHLYVRPGADDSLSEILGPQGAQELERLRYEDLAPRPGPSRWFILRALGGVSAVAPPEVDGDRPRPKENRGGHDPEARRAFCGGARVAFR